MIDFIAEFFRTYPKIATVSFITAPMLALAIVSWLDFLRNWNRD